MSGVTIILVVRPALTVASPDAELSETIVSPDLARGEKKR
jgi:hypothetical protein